RPAGPLDDFADATPDLARNASRGIHLGVAVARDCRLVHTPALQQSRELPFNSDEVEARNGAGLELDEHINVTIGPEVVAKDRAEQGQARDVVSRAERRHRVTLGI